MTDDQSPMTISETSKHALDQQFENRSSVRPKKIAKVDEEEFDGEDEEIGESKHLRELISGEVKMNPNPRVQRYLIAIEYIGTRFAGAQQQATGRTVVGVLQDAFEKFIGQPVSVFCSSRTDAGVHALSNVCHVDIERISKRRPGEVLPPHEPTVVKRAVNHFLQKNEGDIMIIDARCVPFDFHSRYKAQERTYYYRLLCGPDPLSTFEKDRAWHVPAELDAVSMQQACKILVGRHDFSSFRAAACQAKSPIRTLDELNVTEVPSPLHFPSIQEREQFRHWGKDSSTDLIDLEPVLSPVSAISGQKKMDAPIVQPSGLFGMRPRHRCFVVTARARSFLYHQVRLLVGVLKSVGAGDITVTDVERILETKNVSAASPMAPACGLYLGEVKYDLTSDS